MHIGLLFPYFTRRKKTRHTIWVKLVCTMLSSLECVVELWFRDECRWVLRGVVIKVINLPAAFEALLMNAVCRGGGRKGATLILLKGYLNQLLNIMICWFAKLCICIKWSLSKTLVTDEWVRKCWFKDQNRCFEYSISSKLGLIYYQSLNYVRPTL